MSYADGLLSSGERIVYRTKQHPFIFIWGARYDDPRHHHRVLLFWRRRLLDPSGLPARSATLLGWVTFFLFVGGLLVFAWTALRYVNQEYVLTNRRVIQVEGVLNRTATDSSLEKINDAVLTQSIFGRMFDFGDLAVLTAAESGIERMHMLRDPIVFKKTMLDAKHDYEVDMERSGWAPGPPLRADAAKAVALLAAGAAVPAAAGTAAASPCRPPPRPPAAAPRRRPPRADPDEVTRTLANLADLRDRGAITPEEYEAKKADLLGRL